MKRLEIKDSLPCPFCGHKSEVIEFESKPVDDNYVRDEIRFVCDECFAGGPWVRVSNVTPMEERESWAIAVWNIRGDDPARNWTVVQNEALDALDEKP